MSSNFKIAKGTRNRKRKMADAMAGRRPTGPRFGKKWYTLKELPIPDWDQMNLEEVKKNFYQEHWNVKERNEATIKEYMDQNRISVNGHDCPKPVEAFNEFCFTDSVMMAIKAQNFVKPTPIQSQAIPVALSGRDMVGIADTGSGKTLAFILPAITHILGNNHPRNVGEPEVVVLAPTRELAQQIHQVVVSLGPGINVKSECFYGGAKRAEQAVLTEKVFEICIATPGRMVDFLHEGFVKLHRCTFFVLDEADRMLDMGFEPQIKQVIGQSRPDRQMLMFSATWPREIQNLAENYLKDYILVNVGSLQISANHNITQKLEFCENADKPQRIVKIMKLVMQEEENKTLIFVNAKVDVDVLTMQFRLNGWSAMGLHGSKKQPERNKVFSDFKSGKISTLIATDLAARGLDVDDIKYIINYDFPFCSEDYVHRIGRTGRCDRKGTAITFFTQRDRDKAKNLISVLEEAGQLVPPQLRHMAQLPALTKMEKRAKLPGEKKKKKQLKKLMMKSNVNSIPIGSTNDANSLPALDDILDRSVLETANSGGKKKNKRKLLQLAVNSENKVQIVHHQPNPCKKAKVNLHDDDDDGNLCTNPSNKSADDYHTDNFDNPQWAPITDFQKHEENSRKAPPSNFGNHTNPTVTGSVNMQNPNLGREEGHSYEMPFNNNPASANIRSGNNVYSIDNRSMPMNSRNYETSMGPRRTGPSMNVGMPMGPVNMRMPVNAGSMGMHMNSRSMQPSFRARSYTETSFNQRQSNAGWNDAQGWGRPTYNDNNYGTRQTSNWGSYSSSYGSDRNHYSGQSWSGSGYGQY